MISKLIDDLLKQSFGLYEAGGAGKTLFWLLETSLIVGGLIGLVLLIRKPVAKTFGSGAAYALWLLPLGRFFLPELAVLTPPEKIAMAAPVTQETLQQLLAQHTTAPAYDPFTSMIIIPTQSILLMQAILAIWIFCAVLWLAAQLARQALYHKQLMAASHPVIGEQSCEMETLARQTGLRKPVSIRIANNEIGPLVTGLVSPIIILPASFENTYTKPEQQLALLHEFTHIRRHDLWVAFAGMIFRAIQWPNPMVHIGWRAFRADQEASCDALVLSTLHRAGVHSQTQHQKHTYASALLKSACRVTAPVNTKPSLIPAHLTPISPTPISLTLGHEVKERLMLMKSTPTRNRRLFGSAAVAAMIAASLAVTAQYGYAAQDEDSKASPEVTKVFQKKIISTNNDGNEKIIIRTVSGDGEKITVDKDAISGMAFITTDGITNLDTDKEIMFVAKNGDNFHWSGADINCATLDEKMKKDFAEDTSSSSDENKFKFKTKSVVITRTQDTDGNIISEDVQPTHHTIICENGKLVEGSKEHVELQIEGLRTAIEQLKKEEKIAQKRIQETRKQLEKSLVELEKLKAEQQ